MNTNSNTYTIIYSAIIVVIVAFLLAFVSTSLKDKQEANVQLDKKKQILNSLNLRDLDDKTAEEKFKEVMKSETDIDGNVLYTCEVEGRTKYVIPMKGMGLWGPIYCYLAIDDDKSTVFGVYFNHDSETAGLGAEIKDSREWQEKFRGKKIFKNNSADIALSVNKKVDDAETQVDAVTGATLTSDGVTLMFKEGLKPYIKFLTEK
ncbi:MAG: NADH:ubiquinone reductase (Na(+)-transporting) subunit C [Prevotella sp.]|uniref:NADH:ubiquinone reductase (Na(+)-transporting) subunit C n=1 Tax=Prevotella sp. TaxID=59823 RepID=UPI002A2BC117|nr:NADH:ubiquinone reductase (Na(+)-transporting) subunit C [Prevotella sp.]MDD7318212.1 NADH:ubiquinone reductase (Na(+)-transporting) subunit C [Prevotellaceae bacterium]MDY4020899.1 NADH:ubiquinone reductase (Na(+)-transporting) subunit C [Prevotella sp.]